MKNLASCKNFHIEILKPWLNEKFSFLSNQFAAGVLESDVKEISLKQGMRRKSIFYI